MRTRTNLRLMGSIGVGLVSALFWTAAATTLARALQIPFNPWYLVALFIFVFGFLVVFTLRITK